MSRSRTSTSRRSASARSSPTEAAATPTTAAAPEPRVAELTNELVSLRLPALRARFKEVFGRATRSADRAAIANKLAAELERRERPAASPAVAATPSPRRGRVGRFTGLTLEQLQELFVRTLGRASGSTDRRYLEWKIREADKG